MDSVTVPVEWLERVRDVLYQVAHTQGGLGAESEALGSYIPDILGENK